jgi:hypothetical protein
MASNIIHLVLARLPDAPSGTKGISLFLVPKFIPKADGSLGARNPIYCTGLEHKMGIHGNATAQMTLEGATGWMVGEPNKGLPAMFVMMNAARLGVGMQSLGLTEVAYQNAVAYARERLQSRSLSGVKAPDKPADPIIVHPDVRRMLLTARAYAEGARALGLFVALELDKSLSGDDADERAQSADLVALLTPIIKAFITDNAWTATSACMQVFGGHGYIRESGMEQLVRDFPAGKGLNARMRVALALSLGASLVLCGPATAATTVQGAESGDIVSISDETGEVNDLTLESPADGSVVTVRDSAAPLQALGGCDEAGDGSVRCPMRLFGTIEIHLAAGDDRMIAIGPPLIRAFGEEGLDTLRGGTESDTLEGGSGNDTIDGDLGRDTVVGGAGDDTIRGGRGDDTLLGGGSVLTAAQSWPPAGRDELDGGPGNDSLRDTDSDSDEPEIGADLVIGGTGHDHVASYTRRRADLHVDLSRDGGDGEAGEGDSLENVESVAGGRGDDVLLGDGDDNSLFGARGSNRLRGRGGDDDLSARRSTGRNSLRGDVGDDRVFAEADGLGGIRCGAGNDYISLHRPRATAGPASRGPVVSASCEAIAQGNNQWAVDPVPEAPPSRVLLFRRTRGATHGGGKELAVTRPDPPYAELGRGESRRRGVRVRLPARLARHARGDGVLLRAEMFAPRLRAPGSTLQMIWRLRVEP